MVRSDLIRRISEKNPDIQPEEIKNIVDSIFNKIVDTLASGSRVELRGFGTFKTKIRAPRIVRNPATGEHLEKGEVVVVAFKAGKKLSERVKGTLSN